MSSRTSSARSRYLGLGAATVGLLALSSASSFASPLGGVNGLRAPSAVVRAEYQCWWADGDRHCAYLNVPAAPRVYDDYGYGRRHYGYYGNDYEYYRPHYRYRLLKRPEAYWTGSSRWWRSMEHFGRTGND
jgi:hypothetical protein